MAQYLKNKTKKSFREIKINKGNLKKKTEKWREIKIKTKEQKKIENGGKFKK